MRELSNPSKLLLPCAGYSLTHFRLLTDGQPQEAGEPPQTEDGVDDRGRRARRRGRADAKPENRQSSQRHPASSPSASARRCNVSIFRPNKQRPQPREPRCVLCALHCIGLGSIDARRTIAHQSSVGIEGSPIAPVSRGGSKPTVEEQVSKTQPNFKFRPTLSSNSVINQFCFLV